MNPLFILFGLAALFAASQSGTAAAPAPAPAPPPGSVPTVDVASLRRSGAAIFALRPGVQRSTYRSGGEFFAVRVPSSITFTWEGRQPPTPYQRARMKALAEGAGAWGAPTVTTFPRLMITYQLPN